jgi:hypothetical protein
VPIHFPWILRHCWCFIYVSNTLVSFSVTQIKVLLHRGRLQENKTLWTTLKIACSVRRCRSVKTNRGFLGAAVCSGWLCGSSFLLQAETQNRPLLPHPRKGGLRQVLLTYYNWWSGLILRWSKKTVFRSRIIYIIDFKINGTLNQSNIFPMDLKNWLYACSNSLGAHNRSIKAQKFNVLQRFSMSSEKLIKKVSL